MEALEDTALGSMALARAEPTSAAVKALAYGAVKVAEAQRAAVMARQVWLRAKRKLLLVEPQVVRGRQA